MHDETKHSEVRDDLGERGQLIHDVHDDVQFAVLAQQGMRRAGAELLCCQSGLHSARRRRRPKTGTNLIA
jgi:hypothetical protein